MTKTVNQNTGLKNEKDAAIYLNISKQTLIRLRKAGRIGYYRIAKRVIYGQEQLEAFLTSADQQVFSPINIGKTKGGNDE